MLRGYIASRAGISARNKPFVFSLILTLLIGSALSIIFWDMDWDAAALSNPDVVIQFGVVIGQRHRVATPVVIVDIDEETYEAWGRQPVVPRDHLAELLQRVAAGGPKAIVLDIDLSLGGAPDASIIEDALALYARDAGAPPLLLARGFRRSEDKAAWHVAAVDQQPRLEKIVARAPNIRWVSAFLQPERDWMMRRWRPVLLACDDPLPRAYASVALATTSITSEGGSGLEALDRWLDMAARFACGPPPRPLPAPPSSLPWLVDPTGILPIPYAAGFTTDLAQLGTTAGDDGRSMTLFARISARQLINYNDPPPDLSGRVAIIGGTFRESRDFYPTPLGTMPGVYILANLVALGAGPLSESPWWGLRSFLYGLAFFVPFLVAARFLRDGFAILAITIATVMLSLAFQRIGVPIYAVRESVVAGLGLLTMFLLISAFTDAVAARAGDRRPASLFARLVLSDRILARRRRLRRRR